MSITVTGRKMNVTDAMREHVEDKVGDALKVFDISPMKCDVVLRVDKNPSNLERKSAEVTVFVRDSVVRGVGTGSDMYAAIDEAAKNVTRRLRKFKTRVIDRKVRAGAHGDAASIKTLAEGTGDLDLDALMAELSDDEVVRVKEIEFAPMTEEEALVQIDLLGHDFFVYTDRDTDTVRVLYRRSEGGYGLLKEPESN